MPVAAAHLLEFPLPREEKTLEINDFRLTMWGDDLDIFPDYLAIIKRFLQTAGGFCFWPVRDSINVSKQNPGPA